MASNTITTKGTETTNVVDGQESRVDTVDHRSSPAGPGQEEKTTTENIQVIHQSNDSHPAGSGGDPASAGGNSGTDILACAAASVANTVRSAKDAISSSISTNKTKEPTNNK